mmetsp:Transcript_16519/g.19775  ORF Transcript_16519/g.19775 Transcript_16519/m.19775 type:complete len:166 (-) Transcript_16519:284-781(-)
MGLVASVVAMLAKFRPTRNLLLRHPEFFSAGGFSHEGKLSCLLQLFFFSCSSIILIYHNSGPSEEDMANTSFKMDFFGRGFSNSSRVEAGEEPDVIIKTRVHGPEPGYVACSIIIVESALCFTESLDDIVKFVGEKGGVLTAGSVFYPTDLIERLDSAGVHFDVL